MSRPWQCPPPTDKAAPSSSAAAAEASAAAAATSSATASASPSTGAAKGAASKLDPKAQQRVKVAEAMGEAALNENVEIIKKLGMRALRSFAVGGVGLVAFFIVLKRKRREEEAAKEAAKAASGEADEMDEATKRYLQEMGGQGWDVEEGEKAAKEAAARRKASSK